MGAPLVSGVSFRFSLISVLIIKYLDSESGIRRIDRLAAIAQKPGGIFLMAIPIAIIEAALRGAYPNGNQNLVADWANFLTYLTLVVFGYILFSNQGFLKSIKSHWVVSLFAAVGLNITLKVLGAFGFFHGMTLYSVKWIGLMVAMGFLVWFWMIAFLGFGMRFLTAGHKALNYLSEGSLAFYILHQTVILIIGFYILQTNLGLFLAYLVICILSIVGILVLYELIIRRFNPLRFVFGMKAIRSDLTI
ncbi:MAG: hypothetical protein P8075_12515 [Deltaproteobacteria bacterium]